MWRPKIYGEEKATGKIPVRLKREIYIISRIKIFIEHGNMVTIDNRPH